MYVLQQFSALLLCYASQFDSVLASPVELAIDQDVELRLAGHSLGLVAVLREGYFVRPTWFACSVSEMCVQFKYV